MVTRRECAAVIRALDKYYGKITDAAGLLAKPERATVSGYKAVKPRNEMPNAERFKGATFKTAKALETHAKKHLHEYDDITVEEYIDLARELLRSEASDDIMILTRSDGSVSKYRISTNDFVVSDELWNIKSAFKPKKGYDYWREELERNKTPDSD